MKHVIKFCLLDTRSIFLFFSMTRMPKKVVVSTNEDTQKMFTEKSIDDNDVENYEGIKLL